MVCVSIASRVQICHPITIPAVTIINLLISAETELLLKAAQQILVSSPNSKRKVKEQSILHDKCIDHVLIQSQLIYLIGDNDA